MTFDKYHSMLIRSFSSESEHAKFTEKYSYQKDDRDSGFRSWLRYTGNKMTDCMSDFYRVVYGRAVKDAKKKPVQMELF